MRGLDLVLQPGIGRQIADIVVITYHIAFLGTMVGIEQVVLEFGIVRSEVTLVERVYIQPELSAQQVIHGLIEMRLAIVERYAALQCLRVADTVVDI